MNVLGGLMAYIDARIPQDATQLYVVELVAMSIFGIAAWIMGLVHHGRFDLYRVLRNGLAGGASFPPSILLILYPISAAARNLFGSEALKGYLMIAGATGAVLSLYGLFKR